MSDYMDVDFPASSGTSSGWSSGRVVRHLAGQAASHVYTNRRQYWPLAQALGKGAYERVVKLAQKQVNKKKEMRKVSNPDHEAAPQYKSYPIIAGKKNVRQKGHKPIKVSRSLRRKISKVINDKMIHGHFHQLTVNKKVLNVLTDGGKNIWPAGGMNVYNSVSPDLTTSNPQWLFTPSMWTHVVSLLFFKKTATGTELWNSTNSQIQSTGNFNVSSSTGFGRLKFTVKSSHMSYLYKNIGTQAAILEFYVCRPRRKSEWNPLTVDIASMSNTIPLATSVGTVTGVDQTGIAEPMLYLCQSGIIDTGNGVLSPVQCYGVPTFSSGQYATMAIGLDPIVFPTWRGAYAFERIKVTLQPGQEYNLKVMGPQNMEMDSAKWWQNALFQDIQMYSRSVMVSIYHEMGMDTNLNKPEFIRSGVSNSGYGIAVSSNLHVKVSMPETTGLINNTSILGTRKPLYYYVQMNIANADPTTSAVSNPQQPATVPSA
nr:MAG: capsid protein [Cressdnaviricota sp.]